MGEKIKCPSCGSTNLRDIGDGEFACFNADCYLYYIKGKWYYVSCDEYHQHHKKCLTEYKKK